MPMNTQNIVFGVLEAVLVVVATFFATRWYLEGRADSHARKVQAEADRILEEVETRRRDAALEAKDEAIRLRAELDRELTQRRKEVERIERRVEQKEESIDQKTVALDRREQELRRLDQETQRSREAWESERTRKQAEFEADRARQQADLDAARDRHLQELERVAGLTADQARDELVREVEDEARGLAARRLHELDLELREEADRRSRRILATTIQRIASDYVSESTVSVIPLPSDDMKGRIIGREGRNIRALEAATGVDLIVDDTPEAVTISAFDPVRREVARRALNKLLQDGRIHPTRIEEVVAKTRTELEQVMREEGEKIAYEANVPGLHPDLIKLLGRLKFRTSYGQNVLGHSLETSMIGAAIAKRLGRSSKIVHAIAAHHGEEEPQTVEAFIVATADAISGARPGARREMVETYIKRLEALEGVANSFEGVEKSFAIQAGREVRILVAPDSIDDLAAARLARDVSKKIEESLEYPGQIKVTVIRETRAVDYAR